jgi:hypothetical protein
MISSGSKTLLEFLKSAKIILYFTLNMIIFLQKSIHVWNKCLCPSVNNLLCVIFQSRELICERQRPLYGIKCVLRIFWQTCLLVCYTKTGVYKASIIFFLRQYVQPCLLKNPKYTFYTIKSSLKLAYYSMDLFQTFDSYCRRKKKF